MDLFSLVRKLPISHTQSFSKMESGCLSRLSTARLHHLPYYLQILPNNRLIPEYIPVWMISKMTRSSTKSDKWVSVHVCILSLVPLWSTKYEMSKSSRVKGPQRKHRLHPWRKHDIFQRGYISQVDWSSNSKYRIQGGESALSKCPLLHS